MPTPLAILRRTVLLCLAACVASLFAATPAAAAGHDLPAGITLSLQDAERPLVAVIAADIDADGDIDVVATDGSLDLLVWVNDGTGHFTRKRPAPVHEGHADAPGPGADSRAPFSNDYTSSDSPSIDGDLGRVIAAPSLVIARHELTSDRGCDRARSTRSPRGPPFGSSLN